MSPRTGPRRPLVGVRMAETGIQAVDARAKLEGVNRSEMIRLLLAHGLIHMPKGWRPPNAGAS